ncbi:MAG: hypothetical protein PHY86_03405 [Candidatus Gracilibacteria bacterium]|nr:hypothetical protein [Candidatus Gracilibacteria bacterium]
MLYENLLQFIVSNYLNRGEAIQVLKDYALTREDAFDLLNGVAMDLGNKNLAHLQIMVGIFTAIITIFGVFIGIPIIWGRKTTKDILEKARNLEESVKVQKQLVSESKNVLDNFILQSRNEMKAIQDSLEEKIDAQEVRIRWESYINKVSSVDTFAIYTWIWYLQQQYIYLSKYKSFWGGENLARIVESTNKIFDFFSIKHEVYSENYNKDIVTILEKYKLIPGFEVEIQKLIERSEKMLEASKK